MMLFFHPIIFKSTFCRGWGQKNNSSGKTMQTFDIVSKIHRPNVNPFDEVIFLWYKCDCWNQSGNGATDI